jgi:carboxypeptidase Taq
LRYELENQLLSGELAVRNLRDAWNSIMEQRLGLKPQSDVEGVLQDVHWAVGSFGYFPSYALGAVMAAQFYDALRESVPDVDGQIARGDFLRPHGLAAQNVHGVGRARQCAGTAQAGHGKPLSAARRFVISNRNISSPRTVVGSAAA